MTWFFAFVVVLFGYLANKIIRATLHPRTKLGLQRDAVLKKYAEQQKKAASSTSPSQPNHQENDDWKFSGLKSNQIHSLSDGALDDEKRKTPLQLLNELNIPINNTSLKTSEYDPTGRIFQINYRDRDGETTERKITVKRIYRENYRNYIEAYCHLRRDNRTFILERIEGYLIDTATGEMIDPDALSPLKTQQKQAVSGDELNTALHLKVTETSEGWVLHHPNEKVTRKEDRKKREVILYQNKIDAYRTAVRLANECEMKILCIFQHGNYRPKPPPNGSENLRIVFIDLQTPEGMAKMKRIKSLT